MEVNVRKLVVLGSREKRRKKRKKEKKKEKKREETFGGKRKEKERKGDKSLSGLHESTSSRSIRKDISSFRDFFL